MNAADRELERIRELGKTEGARLRKAQPITESEQQRLRVLFGDYREAS